MKAVLIVLVTLLCVSASIAGPEDDGSCLIQGVWYANGARTNDPCDRCHCQNTQNSCTTRKCPLHYDLASCVLEGKVYENGKHTPDPCGRCHCKNGHVNCIKLACRTVEGVAHV